MHKDLKKLGLLFGSIIVLASCQTQTASTTLKNVPQFKNYPAQTAQHTITHAQDIDWASNPDAKMFRTRLREGLKQDPDFNAEYKIVSFGCGTSCQQNMILHLPSGKVIDIYASEMGSEYYLNSAMIVVNPIQEKDDFPLYSETQYYVLKDNKLLSIPVQTQSSKQ